MKKWSLVCGFGLLLIAALFALASLIKVYGFSSEISLPLLAIAGVMALLGALALVAIAFSLVGMSDRTQALGLPNGSVRAVIALSLVVLFAILTVYLFSALNDVGKLRNIPCLTQAARDNFERSLQPGQFISATQNSPSETKQSCGDFSDLASQIIQDDAARVSRSNGTGGDAPPTPPSNASPPNGLGAVPPAGSPAGASSTPPASVPAGGPSAQPPATSVASANPGAEPRYKVYFRDLANTASQDFAKQLLVLIGTLVTSVSGFYFGSKAAADMQEGTQRGGPPNLLSVTPVTLAPGGNAIPVKITGQSLNAVKQAQLTFGQLRITDSNVVSNENEVRAHFTVPPSTPAGPWDLVVTDDAGRQARLGAVIRIGGDANAVTLTGANPKEIIRSGKPVSIVVSGTGLNSIDRADLVSGDRKISGTDVTSSASQVKASFVLVSTVPPGHWDIVVSDAQGQAQTLHDAVIVTEPEPEISGFKPTELYSGKTGELEFTGSNLGQISKIELRSGAVSALGESLKKDDTTASATFAIPASPKGIWNVVATDSMGRELPAKMTLSVV